MKYTNMEFPEGRAILYQLEVENQIRGCFPDRTRFNSNLGGGNFLRDLGSARIYDFDGTSVEFRGLHL